jgi:hypothetical protein
MQPQNHGQGSRGYFGDLNAVAGKMLEIGKGEHGLALSDGEILTVFRKGT